MFNAAKTTALIHEEDFPSIKRHDQRLLQFVSLTRVLQELTCSVIGLRVQGFSFGLGNVWRDDLMMQI